MWVCACALVYLDSCDWTIAKTYTKSPTQIIFDKTVGIFFSFFILHLSITSLFIIVKINNKYTTLSNRVILV